MVKKLRRRRVFSMRDLGKGAVRLPIQTVIIVPSTLAKSKKITASQFRTRINRTRKFVSSLFGGFTSVSAVGGFVLKGKLIRERVAKVTGFADRLVFTKNKARWIAYIRARNLEWGQESMGLIVENDLFFI